MVGAQKKYIDDNYVMKDCFIIHMDILGSRNIILNGSDEDIINFVLSLEDIYEEIKSNSPSLRIKVYSDNIMLYTDDCTQETFDSMIQSAAKMQMNCLMFHKLLFRGGMSDKKMFSNETFSIGKGLLEAYDIESKKAKAPRVVISDDIKFCNKSNLTSTDEDGLLFIDYLRLTLDELGFINEGLMKKHREMVIFRIKQLEKIENEEERIKAAEKHAWLIKYHNSFCDEHDSEHKIEEKYCVKCKYNSFKKGDKYA